jgi:hypothetical protein
MLGGTSPAAGVVRGSRSSHAIMTVVNHRDDDRRKQDAAHNEAARVEMLRMDACRSLGENLEQADALIKAAYELAEGLSSTQR